MPPSLPWSTRHQAEAVGSLLSLGPGGLGRWVSLARRSHPTPCGNLLPALPQHTRRRRAVTLLPGVSLGEIPQAPQTSLASHTLLSVPAGLCTPPCRTWWYPPPYKPYPFKARTGLGLWIFRRSLLSPCGCTFNKPVWGWLPERAICEPSGLA